MLKYYMMRYLCIKATKYTVYSLKMFFQSLEARVTMDIMLRKLFFIAYLTYVRVVLRTVLDFMKWVCGEMPDRRDGVSRCYLLTSLFLIL